MVKGYIPSAGVIQIHPRLHIFRGIDFGYN